MADRLAELYSFGGVTKAQLEGVATDPEGARRGLDAGALEGRHQLLEALALDAPEQVGGRHLDAIAADLVFLHAPISGHRDFPAAQPGCPERVGGGDASTIVQTGAPRRT